MRTRHLTLWRILGFLIAYLVIVAVGNWLAAGLAAHPPSEGFRSLAVLLGLIGTTVASVIAVIVGLSWLPG